MIVFLLAAVIWALGWARGTPGQARLLQVGLLLVAVMALHVVLPAGHPLREATGGSAGVWVAMVVLVAAAWGYGRVLGRVRGMAAERQREPEPPGPFSSGELLRYARHIALREIGGPGQGRLRDARVLVLGAGGLGAPALLYLAGAGVGRIGVIDADDVETSNLQRQVIFRDADVGRPKAQAAAAALRALNPHVEVRSYTREVEPDMAEALFRDWDLVVDGTDGAATHALANRAAVAAGVPLVAGALSQWEGSVAVWDPSRGGPCRACVFPEDAAEGLAPNCAEAGVAGPLPGIVGAALALEAVKVLTGAGRPLIGRILLWDGLDAEAQVVEAEAREGCAVCGGRGLRL